jgi:acyl carrier protein
MDIEASVIAAIHQVAEGRGLSILQPQPQHTLIGDLGLRSLDLAHLIAILEAELKVDPFTKLVSITSIRTVADLCNAYRKCFSASAAPSPSPLDDATERAQARRAATERYRNSA